MEDEHCPKCGAIFPADRAWTGNSLMGWSLILMFIPFVAEDLSGRVKCPGCEHVFEATEYRYFGFVSPRGMKIGIAIALVLFLCFVLYFGFNDEP